MFDFFCLVFLFVFLSFFFFCGLYTLSLFLVFKGVSIYHRAVLAAVGLSVCNSFHSHNEDALNCKKTGKQLKKK